MLPLYCRCWSCREPTVAPLDAQLAGSSFTSWVRYERVPATALRIEAVPRLQSFGPPRCFRHRVKLLDRLDARSRP